MNDETNLKIFRSQGFNLWPGERMLFGQKVSVHFSGPRDGKFVAWVKDWENNETLFCTAPIFLSSEGATSYLLNLLEWLKKVWPIYLKETEINGAVATAASV